MRAYLREDDRWSFRPSACRCGSRAGPLGTDRQIRLALPTCQTFGLRAGIRPGWTVNCEDTVAVADAALRARIEASHPGLWSRIRARQEYVRSTFGIALRDEVLPLSCTAGYLRPFWLAPNQALAFT